MRPNRAAGALGTVLAAGVLAACGAGEKPKLTPEPATNPTPAQPSNTAQREPGREQSASSATNRLSPPPCPPGLANCRRASGTILYVERVDPDGDGDAHFVLLSSGGVTAPGLTILDVRRDLRPSPLPGPGERIAGAGPVLPGSRGQLQIEAVAVRVAP